jgi:uracil-DNA glycosylase
LAMDQDETAARPGPEIDRLRAEIAACRACAGLLPLGPRPVVQIGASARLLIIGQAPGTRVHASGVPWDDASGARLRDWLGVDAGTFYDSERIALMPVGFCYPGVSPGGGDLPPRRECAPLWHDRVLAALPAVTLTVLVGLHAQARYLGRTRASTLTTTVRDAARHLPKYLPLPHPSWRATGWMRRNPWFEETVLPLLRTSVAGALQPESAAFARKESPSPPVLDLRRAHAAAKLPQ